MNTSLKRHPNSDGRPRWSRLPVIALLTLFVVASAFLPLRARSARTMPVKHAAAIYPSATSVAPPPAPVRLVRSFEDEFVPDGTAISLSRQMAPFDAEDQVARQTFCNVALRALFFRWYRAAVLSVAGSTILAIAVR